MDSFGLELVGLTAILLCLAAVEVVVACRWAYALDGCAHPRGTPIPCPGQDARLVVLCLPPRCWETNNRHCMRFLAVKGNAGCVSMLR